VVKNSQPVFALAVVALCAAPSLAAQRFPPDSFTNLQVLPEDINTRALINTMRGFALGLGVRCEFCHVGEPGADLATFDFAADEKATKEKARAMLKMVRAINDDHLAALAERSEPTIAVTCSTCHHGVSKPRSLEDVLRIAIADSGLAGAVSKYHQLRDEYYGGYSYDFGEFTLNGLASDLARSRQVDEALGIIDLNLLFFPQATGAHFIKGEILLIRGDSVAAKVSYERSLELEPNNPAAKRRLAQLGGT
jgi:tetratricopeptide (TPR) repeat protein